MRTTLAAILILFACVVIRCAAAADMYPVTDADRKFLADIVSALQKKDSAWIASRMVYPLSVVVSNRTDIVRSKEEFAPILKRQLTDSVRSKITTSAREHPFKNWQGVMIGDGILWFSEFKHGSDKSWTYGIFAIGGFAFQQKDSFPPKEGATKASGATHVGALGPSITWQFNIHLDNRDQPGGKVWLVVDGERHLITNDPIGGYWIVPKSEYGDRQIPSDALSACTGWWAGSGEDMYVRVVAGRVLVFRREDGETLPEAPPYTLFKTLSVPRK
jgi:hypothetical protein